MAPGTKLPEERNRDCREGTGLGEGGLAQHTGDRSHREKDQACNVGTPHTDTVFSIWIADADGLESPVSETGFRGFEVPEVFTSSVPKMRNGGDQTLSSLLPMAPAPSRRKFVSLTREIRKGRKTFQGSRWEGLPSTSQNPKVYRLLGFGMVVVRGWDQGCPVCCGRRPVLSPNWGPPA